VWGGIFAARKLAGAPVTSSLAYESFEAQADEDAPSQARGAARDIRDSSIEKRAQS
jgi:hypothetical protein